MKTREVEFIRDGERKFSVIVVDEGTAAEAVEIAVEVAEMHDLLEAGLYETRVTSPPGEESCSQT